MGTCNLFYCGISVNEIKHRQQYMLKVTGNLHVLTVINGEMLNSYL